MNNLEVWKAVFENYLREHPLSDGSHDISHFQRMWKLANNFSSSSDDKLVILAACYFHDIVNYPKNDHKRSQSSKDSAIKAETILLSLGFPHEKLDGVKHCIEAHSFSANIQTQTSEAEIIQDADRIESLGAIGLARTFYVAGLMGSKLFCSEDPFAENRNLDDKKFTIDHFHLKLLKLPSTMKTQKGKAEAAKRAEVLTKFLEDLKGELAT
ncbi:MAG TPA: HD domain-containing protein [Pseudobdellovibrionaceae bacterium]|mgnify:CR=1 FL=1|nr:HD domain-containing protein [Pseudobdellovibrionaceae bacterium]